MSNSLSMVEEKLPPGFRFHPRDDELICDYLMKKLFMINSSSSEDPFTLLVEVDLNKCEPWDIPEQDCVGGKEWYFYSQRDRKYATGLRTNRATVSGYWKATGKDRAVVRRGSLVGMRKTLVFYQGRAPKGRKTEWVMHEFRLEGFNPPKLPSSKEDWVLCRVFHKSRESTPPRPNPMNCYDESGCFSLPDLMDSFITFDQTPQTNDEVENNTNANNNNNNNINENNNSLAYEQVPSFSNQTNPNNSDSSPIFHVAQSQPTIIPAGPYQYHAPTYDNAQAQQDGRPTFSALPSGSVGGCDKHVIKAVFSHLTHNVKDSATTSPSPVSLPGGSSSDSYLSDVGFPTMSMWTSHY